MNINRTTLLALVVVFLVGWALASSRPIPAPSPEPLSNRPVARWVVRAAKSLLWVMAFAEEKPAVVPAEKPAEVDEAMKLVKSPAGEESRRIDWSEGY